MISHTNSNTNKLQLKEHGDIIVSETFIVSLWTRVHLHVHIFQPQDLILIRESPIFLTPHILYSFLILFLNRKFFCLRYSLLLLSLFST